MIKIMMLKAWVFVIFLETT